MASFPDSILTKDDMHRRFRKSLLIPTIIPPLTALPAGLIPGVVGKTILGIIALYVIFGFPILLVTTTVSVFNKSKRYPRPAPRWSIPLLGIIYILPGCLLFALVVWLYETYFPHVY